MRIIFIFIIFVISINFSFSQKQKQIEICGTVLDSLSNEKIEYATIQFFEIDSNKLKYGTISDSVGKFCLNNVICQNYVVLVSYVGYKTKKFNLGIPTNKSIFYFKIGLSKSEYHLAEVEIVGVQKGVKVLVDKTIFIPDSLSLKTSITGLDLIGKAPGITVRKSDQTIKLMGNPNVLVLVDGVSNNRNLSSIDPKDIERIEIINNPSAKYDSDVTNVINVILKEERKKGLKISTNLNYFSQNKHNHSKIQIDYEFSKIRLFGMYKIKLFNIYSTNTTYRLSNIDNEKYENIGYSANENLSNSLGNIFQYGMDYYINKKTLLNITGNYEIHNYNSTYKNITDYVINEIPDYYTIANTNGDGQNVLQNYTLYFKRKLRKKNEELTVNTNYYLMQKKHISQQNTKFIYFPDSLEALSLINRNTAYKINSINTKIDYSYPITEKLKTEIGVQGYYRDINNNYYIDSKTSFFKYKDFRSAYYGLATYYKDKISFQVGIRAENYNINIYDSIQFNQWNYLPSFSTLYNIDNTNRIKFIISEKLNYPRYQMLAPFTFYSNDSLTISTGNPYLKPEKLINIEFNYSYKKSRTFLSSSIYYRRYNNLIGLNTDLTGGNQLTEKYDNITFSEKFGGYIYFQTLLLKFIQPSVYANLYYHKFTDNKYSGFTYNMWVSTEILLPFDLYLVFDASLMGKELMYNGYSYQSPLIDEITIGKTILKDKGEISFSLINFFLTDESKDVRWNDNYQEEFIFYPNTKCFLIRFNYFFTKGKKIKKVERVLNMERDEK